MYKIVKKYYYMHSVDNWVRFLRAKCQLSERNNYRTIRQNKGKGGVAYFKTEAGENCSDGHEHDV